jgi:hypothetical protein
VLGGRPHPRTCGRGQIASRKSAGDYPQGTLFWSGYTATSAWCWQLSAREVLGNISLLLQAVADSCKLRTTRRLRA